ncbi:phosphotransferase family protein [Sphingopyxis panaciterrulae]|uniref:Aminoglycoside phosphotransferase (APT) family kinase protein n=1 Tax=Sphingopyxis panaciterrulae TaxID=462372 RepID=A0A7W9ERC7_9SPHN|nr:phosphotransferase family protein [Sphingopyxis panaciterrulae]MBB5707414.1 aminoglycoside phosphotransferase (APT) family kinase protein [Sphingopyxis panaciterrulae]
MLRLSDEQLIADPAPLRHWFDCQLGGGSRALTIEKIIGGASNSLLRVTRGDQQFALRRPPAVSNDRTSHDLARELKLMRALAQTDVPCARLVEGTTATDVIGGPFLVMEWVDGFTPRDPMPGCFADDRGNRRALGDAVIDALAKIALVDWQGVGLGDFGKPDGFLDRQVDRWLSQFQRNQVRNLSELDQVVTWLRTNAPSNTSPGLMHGDYSFANVMVARDAPARIAAIIDWELATIGDPLLDLGHLLSSWEDASSGPTWAYYVDWTAMRSRAEAAERYSLGCGRDVSALPFYMALALFRLAVILEGSYARYRRGQSDNPRHAVFETRVPTILAQAVRLIDHEG